MIERQLVGLRRSGIRRLLRRVGDQQRLACGPPREWVSPRDRFGCTKLLTMLSIIDDAQRLWLLACVAVSKKVPCAHGSGSCNVAQAAVNPLTHRKVLGARVSGMSMVAIAERMIACAEYLATPLIVDGYSLPTGGRRASCVMFAGRDANRHRGLVAHTNLIPSSRRCSAPWSSSKTTRVVYASGDTAIASRTGCVSLW